MGAVAGLLILRRILMKRFTVVIQGPLNRTSHSLNFLDHYIDTCPVVISSWSGDDETNELLNTLGSRLPKVSSLIYQDLPPREENREYNHESTFYWAVKSQYNAMTKVKTKYVIKTRSDEGFYPITNIIDHFKKNNDNILCGNVFFKCFADKPYHIGDHLYVCETKIALKGLKLLLDIYEGRQAPQAWARQWVFPAESVLAFALMIGSGLSFHDDILPFDRQGMVDNFSVYDINSFDDYISCWQFGKAVFSKNPDLRKTFSPLDIEMIGANIFGYDAHGTISDKGRF
jgi:hypothetical protein